MRFGFDGDEDIVGQKPLGLIFVHAVSPHLGCFAD